MADEEKGKEQDSSCSETLTKWEFTVALGVFLIFSSVLFCIYSTMPVAISSNLKLPHSISDLHSIKEHISSYARDNPVRFLVGYCSISLFMHTFLIPGKNIMALLAGAIFGVVKGLPIILFNITAGACSCFFLSKLIGRPIVLRFWPEKLRFFQAQVAKRRDKLLNYMLFLRITPALPGTFVNLASAIVDVPFHIFFFATLFGRIPAAFIIARAGLAIGELQSVKDLYDFQTLSVLFLIGFLSILPTLLKKANV